MPKKTIIEIIYELQESNQTNLLKEMLIGKAKARQYKIADINALSIVLEEESGEVYEEALIHYFVRMNWLSLLIPLLANEKLDINRKRIGDGSTALTIACAMGYPKIVAILLQKKASVNEANDKGLTPLFMACYNKNLEIVKLLLKFDVTVNQEVQGHHALYIACQEGAFDIVKLLLEQGALVNFSKNNGATPLFIACQRGYIEIVKLLLEHQADLHQTQMQGATPFFVACQNGHVDVAKLLLENGADINQPKTDNMESPLFVACFNQKPIIVQFLLENKADVNLFTKAGATPLLAACESQHVEIVNLLLAHGVDINQSQQDGVTPLMIACRKVNEAIVRLLIQKAAETNVISEEGDTALLIICDQLKAGNQDQCEAIIDLLLANNADVNIINCVGIGPLYLACQYSKDRIVSKLLKKGVNVNLSVRLKHDLINNPQDKQYWCLKDCTPLHVACLKGNKKIVELLLSSGADYNLPTKKINATPFYITCQYGYQDIVEFLLTKKDLDINQKVVGHYTALDAACIWSHGHVVPILITHYKKLLTLHRQVDDFNDINYLKWAVHSGNDELAKFLILSRELCSPNLQLQLHQIFILIVANTRNETLEKDIDLFLFILNHLSDQYFTLVETLFNDASPNSILVTALKLGYDKYFQAYFDFCKNKNISFLGHSIPEFFDLCLSHKQYRVIKLIRASKNLNGSHDETKELTELASAASAILGEKSNSLTFFGETSAPSINAFSYLRELGYTAETIKQFREKNIEEDFPLKPSDPLENDIYYWGDRVLSSHLREVVKIPQKGGVISHENPSAIYFYCPQELKKELRESGYYLQFENVLFSPRFASAKGQAGIKFLTAERKIDVQIGEKHYPDCKINYEIKIKQSEARLLCAKIHADDHDRGLLIVPVLFLPKGLHKNSDDKQLNQSLKENFKRIISIPKSAGLLQSIHTSIRGNTQVN